MRYSFKILIISLLVIYHHGLIAQSIEEFISMSEEYNPGLKAMRLDYQAALKVADQVKDYPDPVVSIGLGVLPIETRLGAQRLRLGVQQSIPWKGLLNAKSELALAKAEILEQSDEMEMISIATAIREVYSMLYILDEKKRVLADKLVILDGMETLAKSAVSSGKGKLSNVLLIQRNRENVLLEIDLLEENKKPLEIMINRWSGRELNADVEIVNPQFTITEQEEMMKQIADHYPQFKILKSMEMASQLASELSDLERKPKLSVGLDYMMITRRDVSDLAGNGRDVLMPMGMVSIPLHTDRFDAKKEEERIKQEAFQLKAANLKDKYNAEIKSALIEIQISNSEIQRIQGLKETTQETISLMKSEYASEGTRFEELLRLEMDLVDYDMRIVNAESRKLKAMTVLMKFQMKNLNN